MNTQNQNITFENGIKLIFEVVTDETVEFEGMKLEQSVKKEFKTTLVETNPNTLKAMLEVYKMKIGAKFFIQHNGINNGAFTIHTKESIIEVVEKEDKQTPKAS